MKRTVVVAATYAEFRAWLADNDRSARDRSVVFAKPDDVARGILCGLLPAATTVVLFGTFAECVAWPDARAFLAARGMLPEGAP